MLFVSEPQPHILTRKCGPNDPPARPVVPVLFSASPPQGPDPRIGGRTLIHAYWPFRPVLCAQTHPKADEPSAHASTGSGVLRFGTPFGTTGGTQNQNSRRTGGRLGHSRPARQGLVRVPESNTKYGGKGGITGVSAAPVMPPTISESSGIPKGKKLSPPCGAKVLPLITGQVFLRPQGLRVSDSPQRPRRGEGWHAGVAVVRCPDNRQGAADSIPCRVPCQNQNPPRARGLRPRA